MNESILKKNINELEKAEMLEVLNAIKDIVSNNDYKQRDSSRIYPFMNELASIWNTNCPDWRFGQLMVNIFRQMQIDGKDPFYMEEKDFMEYVYKYFSKEA